jgi:hypothetical protein
LDKAVPIDAKPLDDPIIAPLREINENGNKVKDLKIEPKVKDILKDDTEKPL